MAATFHPENELPALELESARAISAAGWCPPGREALSLTTSCRAQHDELIVGLDTFGRDIDAQTATQPNHRGNDGRTVRTRRHFGDKRPVDLDPSDWVVPQIGQ